MNIHPALQTPHDVQMGLAKRARERRLLLNITQAELAERSGVSLASVRRFETSGEISLRSFLAMALVLGELKEVAELFQPPPPMSLFAKNSRPRKRSRKMTSERGEP